MREPETYADGYRYAFNAICPRCNCGAHRREHLAELKKHDPRRERAFYLGFYRGRNDYYARMDEYAYDD